MTRPHPNERPVPAQPSSAQGEGRLEYRSWLIGPTGKGTGVLDGPTVPENITVIEASQARDAWDQQYQRANKLASDLQAVEQRLKEAVTALERSGEREREARDFAESVSKDHARLTRLLAKALQAMEDTGSPYKGVCAGLAARMQDTAKEIRSSLTTPELEDEKGSDGA